MKWNQAWAAFGAPVHARKLSRKKTGTRTLPNALIRHRMCLGMRLRSLHTKKYTVQVHPFTVHGTILWWVSAYAINIRKCGQPEHASYHRFPRTCVHATRYRVAADCAVKKRKASLCCTRYTGMVVLLTLFVLPGVFFCRVHGTLFPSQNESHHATAGASFALVFLVRTDDT